MSRQSGSMVVAVIGLLVIAGGGGWYLYKQTLPVERSVSGKITSLDSEQRTAVLEVIHPKTGDVIEISGEVSPDCQILMDGKQATMADLAAGMRVNAHGLLYRGSRPPRVVATRVVVETATVAEEQTSSAPAPTTQPATPATPTP
ncbi:MAG: hypothetical protein JXO22_04590 [Phycisphaerae bacterium]|nr:hypothetical protein [Phycisphaerae bacterium]